MRADNSVRKIPQLWAAIGGELIGAFNWVMAGVISGSFNPAPATSGTRYSLPAGKHCVLEGLSAGYAFTLIRAPHLEL
jgi:hypothetical protein